MRPISIALVAATLLSLVAMTGCSRDSSPLGSAKAPSAAPADPSPASGPKSDDGPVDARKIIRNAELGISVRSASDAQREAGKVAERWGGYLVSSEAMGGDDDAAGGPSRVQVVLRVSAQHFDEALDSLRKLGTHVGSESISSKDVTEEWTDLTARIKTQKKLEEQYLEISKSASKVDDLLSVQKQLAEVRGEIEKLEGRQRYLTNQVALSTISVTFETERPLINASMSAFGKAARRAGADVVNVGAAIVVGLIRLAGVFVPVALLLLLPLFLIGRFALRRLLRSSEALPARS